MINLVIRDSIALSDGSSFNNSANGNQNCEFRITSGPQVFAQVRSTADLGRIWNHKDTQEVIIDQDAADGR